MFHVESATSYDGGVVRQLQDVDLHAVLLASELAVFLEERLCMPVEMTYRTGYSDGKPSAWCGVKFPMVGANIPRFLVLENLEESIEPVEWTQGTTYPEFFERMLKDAADSLNRVLPSHQHHLKGWSARVNEILAEAEPVPS